MAWRLWNPFDPSMPESFARLDRRAKGRIHVHAVRGGEGVDPETSSLVRDYALWVLIRWDWRRRLVVIVLPVGSALVLALLGLPVLAITILVGTAAGGLRRRRVVPRLRAAAGYN
jgi:hypothetical protein